MTFYVDHPRTSLTHKVRLRNKSKDQDKHSSLLVYCDVLDKRNIAFVSCSFLLYERLVFFPERSSALFIQNYMSL